MFDYRIKAPAIEKMLKTALSDTWNLYEDVPWDLNISRNLLMTQPESSLLAALPEYQKLSATQQDEISFKETIYHVSNLLAGEYAGVFLLSQIIQACPENSPDLAFYFSTILVDERNHSLALSKYLHEKIGICYQPHPQLERILKSLKTESSYEICLFIGQVVLEWTATSLLSSLFSKKQEPIFSKILKRLVKDEVRHLLFSRVYFDQMGAGRKIELNKSTEDLIFESIVSCTSSFFAIPVWKEYDFSLESCREYAVQAMIQKGVIRFYSSVLPVELKRCHLYSDRLMSLLENEFKRRLITDQWSFEPQMSREVQDAV